MKNIIGSICTFLILTTALQGQKAEYVDLGELFMISPFSVVPVGNDKALVVGKLGTLHEIDLKKKKIIRTKEFDSATNTSLVGLLYLKDQKKILIVYWEEVIEIDYKKWDKADTRVTKRKIANVVEKDKKTYFVIYEDGRIDEVSKKIKTYKIKDFKASFRQYFSYNDKLLTAADDFGNITVIDVAKEKIVAQKKVKEKSIGLFYPVPGLKKIYYQGALSKSISVIDDKKFKTVDKMKFKNSPSAMVYDDKNNRLYIGLDNSCIQVHKARNNELVETIKIDILRRDMAAMEYVEIICLSDDGKYLIYALHESNTLWIMKQ